METAVTQFLPFANVILGLLMGLLVGIPVSWSMTPVPAIATLIIAVFTGLGGLAGYRRRNSRGFMYLAIISVLVLTSIISSQLTKIQ